MHLVEQIRALSPSLVQVFAVDVDLQRAEQTCRGIAATTNKVGLTGLTQEIAS
jgi:hypothetical protein